MVRVGKSNALFHAFHNLRTYYCIQRINNELHYYDLVCEYESGDYKKVPCKGYPEDIITINYLQDGLYPHTSNFKINTVIEQKKSISIPIDVFLYNKQPKVTFQPVPAISKVPWI